MPGSPEKTTEVSDTASAPVKRKRPGTLFLALAAAVTCGTAGAASYLLSPLAISAIAPGRAAHALPQKQKIETPTPASSPGKTAHGGQGGKKPNDKKKPAGESATSESEGSRFFVNGDIGIFVPRPIVVSLKPQGRVRYLRVGLAVETTPDSEHVFLGEELRIIDILTSYLRAVPVTALEDPVAMARIREQLARRVSFVVEPAPVSAVLITDFILS